MAERVDCPPSRMARAPACSFYMPKQGSGSRLRRAYLVLALGVSIHFCSRRKRALRDPASVYSTGKSVVSGGRQVRAATNRAVRPGR